MPPANFLHGVEIIETNAGAQPIEVVLSAVIGLVGSAPIFAVPGALQRWQFQTVTAAGTKILDANGNVQQCIIAGTTGTSAEPSWSATLNGTTSGDGGVTWQVVMLATSLKFTQNPVLVGTEQAASGFGPLIQGFTIPYALSAIQQQGAGQTIVVNVFDITKHNTAVSAQAITMPVSGVQAVSLGHMGIADLLLTNTGASVKYINGTDFTLDSVNGIILAKSGGALTPGQSLLATYSYADPSKITDASLVGSVSSGIYTGIQAWLPTFNTMGFWPKILIAPAYSAAAPGFQAVGSQDATVAAALTTIAATIRGMALIDSAPMTQVATAESNRGLSTSAFDTSSNRAILCFPWQYFFDNGIVPTGITFNSSGVAVQNAAEVNVDSPYSQWFAGVIAATDLNLGYWFSPSNKQVIGILGGDVNIYSSYMDPNSDTNILNSDGIVTVFNGFATGLRTWGNRSADFPTNTQPDNFISIRRTMDVIESSIQQGSLQFLDLPITSALVTAILASINAFLLSKVQNGTLITGSAASYNTALNPPTQIANGQLVFTINAIPPPPLERLTWDVTIDINLLSNISAGNSASAPAIGSTAVAS